jgi:hypothetical protein
MKSLTFDKIEVNGNQVTITGTISDKQFTQHTQQTTIMDFPKKNPFHVRHIQLSNQAQFLKRYGSNSFALENCEFTKLGEAIEPSLIPPDAPPAPSAPIKRKPPSAPPAPAVAEPIPVTK